MAASPNRSPNYRVYRTGVAAAEIPAAIAAVSKDSGINMSMYEYANVQVLPSAGANPSVEVYWWSEKAGKFIKEHTAIAKAGIGANVPYEFTVQCLGRIMYVAVTAIAAGSTDICVAGFLHEAG